MLTHLLLLQGRVPSVSLQVLDQEAGIGLHFNKHSIHLIKKHVLAISSSPKVPISLLPGGVFLPPSFPAVLFIVDFQCPFDEGGIPAATPEKKHCRICFLRREVGYGFRWVSCLLVHSRVSHEHKCLVSRTLRVHTTTYYDMRVGRPGGG